MKEELGAKYEQVKEHIKYNQERYIIGGVAFVAGGLVVGTLARGPGIIQIIDAIKIQYKSPTTNTITTVLVRRGHPGNIVHCIETGEKLASQNAMAKLHGINPGELSQHLRGHVDSVKGRHYRIEGEAQAA